MAAKAQGHTVTLAPSGWTFDAGAGGVTLLAAAAAAGIALPSSCRNGTCRTCICRMTAGSVSYRIEWPGLSREEKAKGWILPCVAVAESDLSIEARHAERV